MKTKNLIPVLSIALITLFGLTSCKDTSLEYRKYTANVPQYMSYDEMRKPVKATTPTGIKNGGKIYIHENFLFVNEKYKGIHIFDNTNPAIPVNVSFIDIPGTVDLAIRGHYLYADSYVDLVIIDIENIHAPVEVGRMKDIFPYTIPETTEPYPIANIDQSQGVIVNWQVQQVTEKVESGQYNPFFYYDSGSGQFIRTDAEGIGAPVTTKTVGVGGSMARFIINGDHFYGLNQSNMQVINIEQPYRPFSVSKIEMARAVETVFIEDKYLYVGTQTGMLIYDISNSGAPAFKSEYNHFQSCDPVVVKDQLAYVTLRAGNRCGNWQNLLEVIDLKNIAMPVLLKSYPMTEPYGLGIDNKTLFVCDGKAGLKIFDASDPLKIDQHLLKQYSDLNAYDVIPLQNVLIMIADDGIYQYSYANMQDIKLLSKIPISGK